MRKNTIKSSLVASALVVTSILNAPSVFAQSVETIPNAPVLHGVMREGKEIIINYSYTHLLGATPVDIQFYSGTLSNTICNENGLVASSSDVTAAVAKIDISFANNLELPSCFIARTVAANETESENSNQLVLYREQAAPTPEQTAPQVLAATTTTEPPKPQVKAVSTLVDTGVSSLGSVITGSILFVSTYLIWVITRRTKITS